MTTAERSACDPYFSDNVTHEFNMRAYADPWSLYLKTRAMGSNDDMGSNNDTTFTQLIKEGPSFFRKGYCP